MPKLAIQRDDGTTVAAIAVDADFGRMLVEVYGGEGSMDAKLTAVLAHALACLGHEVREDSWGGDYGDWLAIKKGKTKRECHVLGFTAVTALPDV